MKIATRLGLLTGGALLIAALAVPVATAQGPFTAQIQRMLNALGITFEVSGNMGVADFFTLTTVNTSAATGSDCDAAAETGRFHLDSTNDSLEICSGASGWFTPTPAALVVDSVTMNIANPDIQLSRSAAGTLSIAAVTGTNNEVWTIDLETTANTITWATSTGVTSIVNPFDFTMGAATQILFDNLEGSNTSPAICFDDAGGICDTGIFQGGTDQISFTNAGTVLYRTTLSSFVIQQGNNLSFDTTGGVGDAFIEIDAANVLKLGTGDNLFVPDSIITAGSGTGVTVNAKGYLRRQVYKITVLQSQWIDAATTHDLTIATLPAKTRITDITAEITEQFACTATCTSSTLSMTVGVASGDLDAYLLTFDVDAATAQFGLIDTDRGVALDQSVSNNGEVPNWSGTTAISARLTSGTGNLGDGAATNLSGGDVTFYITTEEMP